MKHTHQKVAGIDRVLRPEQKTRLRTFFGEQFEELLTVRDAAFKVLASGDSNQRCGALQILDSHWELDDEIFIPLCRSLVERDVDGIVEFAIYKIGRRLAYTANEEVTRLLGGLVLDPLNLPKKRANAFRAMWLINQVPPIQLTVQQQAQRLLQDLPRTRHNNLSEEDLDWVKSFFDS